MATTIELSESRAALLNRVLDVCEKNATILDMLEKGDVSQLIQSMRISPEEPVADDDTVTSGYSDAQSDKDVKGAKKEKKPYTMKTQPGNFDQACLIAKAYAPEKMEGRKFDVKGSKGKFLDEMKQLHKELKATGGL